MSAFDVAIVGSGFAGSILSRALRSRGRSVALLERGRHPRFALGESSTPLAAIALERLAREYGLEDLAVLAAYGRWVDSYPELRRGLKRGFTFYRHRPGEELTPGPQNRMLVAASPDDAVADSHWLRADVDRFLVERAAAEGVDYREACEVTRVAAAAGEVNLVGRWRGRSFELEARFVVDASGAAGVVAERMGSERLAAPARFRSSVVGGHFSGVRPLAELWREAGIDAEAGPYPDERAAVHHLLDEGWVYALPFDHDCVSAGIVLDGDLDPGNADDVWQRISRRYPTLGGQFDAARLSTPLTVAAPLQYRRRRAVGRSWAALPHAYAFFDPMFSTGIAWSLLGVERLAALLAGSPSPGKPALDGYGELLAAEADQIERLIYGAGLARRDFRLFAAHSQLYFALVSFAEVRQRLLEPPTEGWAADGFLGGGDPTAERLLSESVERLETLTSRPALDEDGCGEFQTWVADSVASRNVAGLADPARRNLYPVDLDLLVERAPLLGLTPGELRPLLPRLRGLVERRS